MAGDLVILDSSFLVAFHNSRDVHHPPAARAMGEVIDGRWGRALLLEYVLLEVGTVLLARLGHDAASRVVRALLGAREVDFASCSDFFDATLAVFLQQPSRSLSFVDSAIVHVARSRSGARVATFDTDLAGLDGVALVPV